MNIKKMFYKAKKKVSDHSPEILLVAGVVSFIGTVVLACYETTKVEEIIDKHEKNMHDIRVTRAKVESGDPEYDEDEYTEEDAKKDKFIFTVRTGGELLKNYAPAIGLGAVSLFCFLSSYKILKKRYVAASALAYSISEAFAKYRERVVSEYGADVDEHLYLGTIKKKIETLDENGKKKEETVEELDPDANGIPLYAKFFDEANRQWNKNPSVNLMFLKGIEIRMNDKFHEQGHVLLNQVYRALDIPETDLGNEVGWFESHGDQYIDFGIFNGSDERKRAFVNGYEPSILLCFNCVPKWEGDLPKF